MSLMLGTEPVYHITTSRDTLPTLVANTLVRAAGGLPPGHWALITSPDGAILLCHPQDVDNAWAKVQR